MPNRERSWLTIRCVDERRSESLDSPLRSWARAVGVSVLGPQSQIYLVHSHKAKGLAQLFELAGRFLYWENSRYHPLSRSRLLLSCGEALPAFSDEDALSRLTENDKYTSGLFAEGRVVLRIPNRDLWEKQPCGLYHFDATLVTQEAPFFGRGGPLRRLERWANRKTARPLIVDGEAGCGKTALLEEMARRLRRAGRWILVERFSPLDRLPYLPFRRLLAQVVRDLAKRRQVEEQAVKDDLLAQFPDPLQNHILHAFLRSQEEPLPLLIYRPEQSAGLIERALGELFVYLGTLTPFYLIADDLHRADFFNFSFIQHLAEVCRGSRFYLLVGGRLEWQERWTEKRPPTLSLGPLEPTAARKLAASYLGAEAIGPRLFALLEERCLGNPLYQREMLALLRQRKKLLRGETPELTAEEGGVSFLPPTRARLIRNRYDELSETKTRLLQIMALAAAPLSFAEVKAAGAAVDLAPQTVAADLGELQQQQLLQVQQDKYRFSHELLRQTAWRKVRRPYTEKICLALAGLILQRGKPGNLAEIQALSYYFSNAGRVREALYFGIRAARLQGEKGNIAEALQLWGKMEALTRRKGLKNRHLGHAILRQRIKLLLYSGKYAEAAALLKRGLSLAASCSASCRFTFYVHHLYLLYLQNDFDCFVETGERYVQETLRSTQGQIFTARLQARLAWGYINFGKPEKGEELLLSALKQKTILPRTVIATLLLHFAWLRRLQHRTEEALHYLQHCKEHYLRENREIQACRYYLMQGSCGIVFKDRLRCLPLLQTAASLFLHRGMFSDYAAAVNNKLGALALLDRYREAEDTIQRLKKYFLLWKRSPISISIHLLLFCNLVNFYSRLGQKGEVKKAEIYARYFLQDSDIETSTYLMAQGRLSYFSRRFDEAYRHYAQYLQMISEQSFWREDLHQLAEFFRLPLFAPSLAADVDRAGKLARRLIEQYGYQETKAELQAIEAARAIKAGKVKEAGEMLARLEQECKESRYLRLNFQVYFYAAALAQKVGEKEKARRYCRRAGEIFQQLMAQVPERFVPRYRKDPLFGSFLAGQYKV